MRAMTRDGALALWERVVEDCAATDWMKGLGVLVGVCYSLPARGYFISVWHEEDWEGDVDSWGEWEHVKQMLREDYAAPEGSNG